ncbi:MAG: NADP-dependent oxidoreductase [Alphaproteobacteria bacterium]|nr:NADP-dependent oxidoreductase [Alphaproteobacteria bacterium]
MAKNLQWVLESRPKGWVREDNFRLVEGEVPRPGPGQVLVRNLYLSLDPYMRGRMDDAKSYSAKVELGQVMVGGTVGEVVESNNPSFKPGEKVVGYLGWQLYALSDGRDLNRIAEGAPIPLSAYLGPVGMPGVTAWVGLFEIGNPRPGETVVVSAASGAVGSVVGQLAKRMGCRVVGIAGGREKCDYVVKELGFDACADYKAGELHAQLKAACPAGIDVYFENVGGEILDTVLRLVNTFARVPLCGLISQYNETDPRGMKMMGSLLVNRVRLQGFIVSDNMAPWPKALRELGQMVARGQLKYRESVAEGIKSAPRAFIGMLKGENLGKQLVKLT